MAAIKIVAKSSLAPKQNSTHEDPWRALRAVEREIAVMKMVSLSLLLFFYICLIFFLLRLIIQT